MPATYEPIATTTLGSAAASITFSSIASSWTDLRVVLVSQAASQDNSVIQFNNDTGTNYSWTQLYGDGGSASSANNTGDTKILLGVYTTSPRFGLSTADIFSYAGSTYKTVLATASGDENGSGIIRRNVGLWRSTLVITSIKLLNGGGANFATGTTATLYGIKNA